MKIAIGGFGHESTTFASEVTAYEDFKFRSDAALLPEPLEQLFAEQKITPAPLFHAYTTPGGIVTRAAYSAICDNFIEKLKEVTPVDGLLLYLHGSMVVESFEHGEIEFVKNIRKVLGPRIPISCAMDLHGNLTPELIQLTNLITAYRTAPHRDGLETTLRAAKNLIAVLRENTSPKQVMIRVPLLYPGEKVVTEVEPGKTLYGLIPEVEKKPEIIDASIFVGFAWADMPYAGASVVVVAHEIEAAQREARFLADSFWQLRHQFGYDCEALPTDDAVAVALQCDGAVFISDSGDNLTAGAPGNNTRLLQSMLEAKAKNSVYAPFVDADAVAKCVAAGINSPVLCMLGSKSDPRFSRPLEVNGIVKQIQVQNGVTFVVFDTKGIDVILVDKREPFYSPDHFASFGINILEKKITVVKLGYLFPELRDVAKRAIIALSPGVTTLKIEDLPFTRVQRPIYPLDSFDWNAGDADIF